MLRRLFERLSRNRVIRRRLPERVGRRILYASPDSALSYLKPDLELIGHDLFDLACNRLSAGDVVWDIGANVGMFSFAAAHLVGADGLVLAIEADPFLASLLQRSKQDITNQDLNIEVVCAAAADRCGVARFLIARRGRSSNGLEESGFRSQAGGMRYPQFVPTLTLDRLLTCFRPPRLVKIDVEGAEELVLRGATSLLSEHRPAIYIEVGQKQSVAVTSILQMHHYRLFHGGAHDEASNEIQQCSFNTLAVPVEATPP